VNNFAARTIFAAVLLAGVAGAHGQVLSPIAFTFDTSAGETIDQLGLPTDGNAIGTLGDSGDYIALQKDDPSAGLPDDGTIVSASNTATKIATFQLEPLPQPDVLLGSGTLILTTPASYSNLAFLINSISPPHAGAYAYFTLNFSDGSSDTLSTGENVPNWLGGEPGAPGGSVALSTEAAYNPDPNQGLVTDPLTNFDEYDFTLSADDTAKTLVSISINANSGELLTYAISGTDPPLDLPEPSTWGLLATALGGSCLVRRLRPAVCS